MKILIIWIFSLALPCLGQVPVAVLDTGIDYNHRS